MRTQTCEPLLILAIFIASGVSFLDGKFARTFVRITVGVVGLTSFLLIAGAIIFAIGFSAGFGARSFGGDGLRVLGATLLALYFIVCALSCLPFLPQRYLHSFGWVLHFVYMPICVLLTCLGGAIEIPFDFRLSGFANTLSLGLIYAMLWFRMIGMQKPVS